MEDISVHHHDFFQFFSGEWFYFLQNLKKASAHHWDIKRGQFVFDNRTSTNEIWTFVVKMELKAEAKRATSKLYLFCTEVWSACWHKSSPCDRLHINVLAEVKTLQKWEATTTLKFPSLSLNLKNFKNWTHRSCKIHLFYRSFLVIKFVIKYVWWCENSFWKIFFYLYMGSFWAQRNY